MIPSFAPLTLQTSVSIANHPGRVTSTAPGKTKFSEIVMNANSLAVDPGQVAEGKLGGLLLGNLVQLLLPEQADGLTGQSFANGYWKSFLSDAIGESMSKSEKIDLRLERT
jgi:hypothetical protein